MCEMTGEQEGLTSNVRSTIRLCRTSLDWKLSRRALGAMGYSRGKQRIVAECYGGPRLVSVTARRNGLSANQLFTCRWRAKTG